jgi:hypothetical protein
MALLTFLAPGTSSHRGRPATEIMTFEKNTIINLIFFYFAQQFWVINMTAGTWGDKSPVLYTYVNR